MKNTIKWGLPLILAGIITSCSFFKSSEQPKTGEVDSLANDTTATVVLTDSTVVEQDSVAQ